MNDARQDWTDDQSNGGALVAAGGQSLQQVYGSFTPDVVLEQIGLIQQVMKSTMKSGEHYGVIPGTNKPSLLKAGAEKLGFTFRLVPRFEVEVIDLGSMHREYRVSCRLESAHTGQVMGEGLGSCSTMESKYRYRTKPRTCPECGSESIIKGKAEYGGGWLCWGKRGGCGAKFPDQHPAMRQSGKIENPDVADVFNTVLKMAKKRAHVDAILTATAASDIFTQDVEDMPQQATEPPQGNAGRQEQHHQQQQQRQQPQARQAQPRHNGANGHGGGRQDPWEDACPQKSARPISEKALGTLKKMADVEGVEDLDQALTQTIGCQVKDLTQGRSYKAVHHLIKSGMLVDALAESDA